MKWLDDDVIYGVACTLLLMLLVREVLATVAQCVPLSRMPHWLSSAVQHAVSGIESFCVILPGLDVAASRNDISTQVHPGDLIPTSAPRDLDVNTDKEKVECNGAISAPNMGSNDERCSLRRKVDTLNVELAQSRQLVANLQQTEQSLRQRLGEKLITQFERNLGNGKFENVSVDEDYRPTSLIRRFDDVYSDERVELLDVLEQTGQGQGADLGQCRTEFNAKTDQQSEQQLLLSIIVGCFELSQQRIEQLIDDLHKPLLELRHQQRPTRPPAAAAADDDDDDDEEEEVEVDDDDGDDVKPFQLKHFDDAVFSFLRQAAAQRVFSPCIEVIYEHLQLAEHLPVKNSNKLRRFVAICARLAWSLTAQRPPYVLEYQLRGAIFDDDRHRRFHTSDPSSTAIVQVVWPGLVEQSTGFCVSKAVVVT